MSPLVMKRVLDSVEEVEVGFGEDVNYQFVLALASHHFEDHRGHLRLFRIGLAQGQVEFLLEDKLMNFERVEGVFLVWLHLGSG